MDFKLSQESSRLYCPAGTTEIQRAARWLVRNRISFAGDTKSYGVSRTGGGGSTSRASVAESLLTFNARMDRVSVENLPKNGASDSTTETKPSSLSIHPILTAIPTFIRAGTNPK